MLPAPNRLRRREDFTTVYSKGDRHYGKYLRLRVYNTNNPEAETQIGIVVSKKFSKKAVIRNLIRRQIRAIFRAFLPQLRQGLQIVITVVTVSALPKYLELKEDLTNLLTKAQILQSNC
ncbi:ribonuclease P protein component [Synechococcus sp. PCC 7502]|uniref:ribonuclease P protein component n=1 Tax=Synechococcus sp. PCC 7502 TaxID=1173263 RepID=UPI00029FF1DD|nr:ribonuclease P protein component [Synechococcus sp. PCC 7502]AFY74384.1 ribonuclease P protein component [Synechococcus sp. PCC 7502]